MSNKIKELENRKIELIKRIQICKEYKEKLVRFVEELDDKYQKGIISYDKYCKKINKVLEGRSLEQWIKYYDEYISYYEINLKYCEKEIKKEKGKTTIGISIAVLVILFIIGISLFFLKPTITGYTIEETLENITLVENVTQIENVTLAENVSLTENITSIENISLLDNLTNENIILIINESISEISYYTNAPYLVESIKEGVRKIEVRSNISYNNIKTYINIPETKIVKKLYKNGIKIEASYIDTNNNGYYDRVEWISNSSDNFTLEVFNNERALQEIDRFGIFNNISMNYDTYYLESDVIKIERLTNLSDLKDLYYDSIIENVSTKIIAINHINISNATVKLEKLEEVNVILKCKEFNFNNNKCDSSWDETDIKFREENNKIIFVVNEFSAYSGGLRRGLGQNLTYQVVVGSIGMIGATGNGSNYTTTFSGVASPIGNITASVPEGYANSTNYKIYLGYTRTLEAGPNFLYCNVTDYCNYVDVFHIYALTNAHAELSNYSNFNYKVCCKNMGNATLNNLCSGSKAVTILRLYQESNSHVELGNFSNYDAKVCLNSDENINCAFKTDCSGYDTCVATVYQGSNSHVADCSTNPYSTKICCSISEYVGVAPVVILNKPINMNNSVNFSSVTFNCSVIDGDNNLVSLELYSDFNGSFKGIQTSSISGGSNELTTTHTISNNGRYFDKGVKWNCRATDSEGNVDWADSNFTFSSWDSGSYNDTRTDNVNITLNYTDATNTSYKVFGNYTSQVFGNNSIGVWNISWVENELENTGLNVKAIFSNDESQWTGWSSNLSSPSGIINSSAKYVQYRAMLYGDSINTPYLIAVNLTKQRNIVPYNPSPLINSTDNSNSTFADLNCWFTPNDAENNTITCDMMWLKNNNSYWNNTGQSCIETLFINVLESENTSVAERWSCMARVCDDLVGCSNWVNSTQLFILGVSLNSPSDKQNLSTSNVRFKYRYYDDYADSCELFGNWSGSWANEQNRTVVSSGVISEFDAENLSQGGYKWNARCNRSNTGAWTWADNNFTFRVDLTSPNLTAANLTSGNGSIVNETIPIGEGETLTITAMISDAFGTVNRVWAIIWDGVKGIGAIIWQGFLSLIGVDIWQGAVSINESFVKEMYNISIFANDTAARMLNRTNITSLTNLVGYWRFDENNGTIAKDYSIGARSNGTLIKGVNWTNDGAPGFGSGVEFDGISSYVNVSDNDGRLNLTKVSIDFWFKPKHTYDINTEYASLIYNPDYYEIVIDNGIMVFSFNNINVSSTTNIWIRYQWYYILATYDNNIQKLYVNGLLENSTTSFFYVKNSSENKVAAFSSKGDIILRGSCIVSSCAYPGDDAFVIQNSSLETVAYVNKTGDLCIEDINCNANNINCSSVSDGSFIVKDSDNNIVSYINSTGGLCLIGGVVQNGNP